MFGLAAWNRLLRKQQEEKVVFSAYDVLGQKHISEQAGGQPDVQRTAKSLMLFLCIQSMPCNPFTVCTH